MVWLGGAPISPRPAEEAQDAGPGGTQKVDSAPAVAQEVVPGPVNCAKCNREMQEGSLQAHFLLNGDFHLMDSKGQVEWVEAGHRTLRDRWLGRNRKKTFTMKAYRCPSCGYLESYAR